MQNFLKTILVFGFFLELKVLERIIIFLIIILIYNLSHILVKYKIFILIYFYRRVLTNTKNTYSIEFNGRSKIF